MVWTVLKTVLIIIVGNDLEIGLIIHVMAKIKISWKSIRKYIIRLRVFNQSSPLPLYALDGALLARTVALLTVTGAFLVLSWRVRVSMVFGLNIPGIC